MELKEALMKRRSIRKYTEEPVSREMIDELMHAAMAGPSACNKMPWEFYVTDKPELLAQLRTATVYTNMVAPLAIVVCGCTDRMLPENRAEFWVQDCSAATENILLSAVDMGLGTVWCGIYPKAESVEKVQAMLGLPENHIPMNIIYVGHPAEDKEARDQYVEEWVHYI